MPRPHSGATFLIIEARHTTISSRRPHESGKLSGSHRAKVGHNVTGSAAIGLKPRTSYSSV